MAHAPVSSGNVPKPTWGAPSHNRAGSNSTTPLRSSGDSSASVPSAPSSSGSAASSWKTVPSSPKMQSRDKDSSKAAAAAAASGSDSREKAVADSLLAGEDAQDPALRAAAERAAAIAAFAGDADPVADETGVRFQIGSNRGKEDDQAMVQKKLKKQSLVVARLRASSITQAALPKFDKPEAGQPEKKMPPKAIPKHMDGEPARSKANSTSTLFVNSTLANPDNEEVLRCMAVALFFHMKKTHASENQKFLDIFDERKFPINNDVFEWDKPPEPEVIFQFVSLIFRTERLPIECGILCLSYIERIIGNTRVTIHATNWRRIVLSALILASKVWEDQAVWNVDFLSVFPAVSVRDLNKLEAEVLKLLHFNVSLNAGVYAKYYFALRDLSDLDDQHFPLRPLDKDGEQRLEIRSQGLEARVRPEKTNPRAQSMNPLPVKSPPVILN